MELARPSDQANCGVNTHATMPTQIKFNGKFDDFPQFYYYYRIGMYIFKVMYGACYTAAACF